MPTALATTDTAQVIQGLKDDGVVYDATDPGNTRDHFGTHPSDSIVVITPGTDDGTLIARSAPLMGKRTTLVVNYAQSFWPIVAGKSGTSPLLSPTYDASKEAAETTNLQIMRALRDADGAHPSVIYTGYSQGADALGNAAETAWDEGLLDSTSMVVLASDPRSPWGIKSWLATMPLLPQIATAIGVESDGARDPAKTGDAEVLSVIIVGDPVSNFQWVWYRPVSSLLVDLAGFLTIHNGLSNQTYGDIDDLGDPTLLKSADGNTTYAIYDGRHPLALLVALIYDELGIAYTDADLDRWDQAAEAFYPLQRPTVENAAVPVQATPPSISASAPVSAQSYSVTVPSEVATGERAAEPAPRVASSPTAVADGGDDFVAGVSAGSADGGDGIGHGDAGPALAVTADTGGSDAGGDSESGEGGASDGAAGAESSSGSTGGDGSGSTGGDAGDPSDAGSAADSGSIGGDASGASGGEDASSSGSDGDSGGSTGTSSAAP